ncbi:MAG: hypothetical protein Q9222_000985 [Ikaeria aurantiellina]
MDYSTITRLELTNNQVQRELPTPASPEWTSLATKTRTLLEKLAHHPAMAPNLQQTYMTPAASKNKVYFMWDFVGRTLSMIYGTKATLENLSKAAQEKWMDAVGRAQFSGLLILDTRPGMLDSMIELTYPGQGGEKPEFGEEILEIARGM